MINERPIDITFIYNGKTEKRTIWKMHISYYRVKDFYRVPGKKLNYDIFKKDGVWCNMLVTGLKDELLQLVGNAIDEVEKD